MYDRLVTEPETYRLIVDDVELSALEADGWTHSLPWDFVAAAKAGTANIDLSVPFKQLSKVPLMISAVSRRTRHSISIGQVRSSTGELGPCSRR